MLSVVYVGGKLATFQLRPGRRGKRSDNLWLLANRFADQKCFSQGGDLTGPRADEADSATVGFTARTGEGQGVFEAVSLCDPIRKESWWIF